MRIKDARQTFVGIWIRSLIEGKAFEVWGGEQLRDFNYVDDCVEALLVAAIVPSTKGRVFNLGHSSPVSLCELAKLMVSINGGGVYVTREFPAERKRIDIGDYYSDHTLFTSVTGWTPKTSLEDGLAMTLRYFKEKLPLYL
jgi:nucleoside-diphosphate-sugar epimerase